MLNRAIGFYEGMPLDNSNVFQTKRFGHAFNRSK